MKGTLRAECLLAVTGLWPAGPATETQRKLAERLPERLAARIRKFLSADKPAPLALANPPKKQEALRKQVMSPIDSAEAESWMADEEDPELAAQWLLLMQQARAKVKAAWPVYPDPSLGVHNFELAADELLDVLLVLVTLDDIETVFSDLDSHVLLPSQVSLFAEVYPDLYESLKASVFEELAPYIEIQGEMASKKTLSPIKEELLRVFMQLPTDAPFAAPAEQPQAGPKPTPSRPAGGENLQTPAEHIAARRVST